MLNNFHSLDQKGKTNWAMLIVIGLIIAAVYFLFLREEEWATPLSVNGTVEVHNTRKDQTIKVGFYQYSGVSDAPPGPLGDLIVERTVYTCTTTFGIETFSYKTGCFDWQVEGNYFVVFVQGCPDGWKVLDVRDGPVYTNVDLVRRWGEGIDL